MKLGDKGNVAIITALCLPAIIGGAAYGIEVGFWRYDQVRIQQAADAAAYAAAVVRRADGAAVSADTLTTAGTTAAVSNGYSAGTDTITINTPSTATPSDPNSVEAVISRTEPPIFTTYIRCMLASWQGSTCTGSVATVKASSTASYSDAGDACVLALSHSAGKAADFAGNSSLDLSGCSVMSDSLSSSAFNLQGSAVLTVPCVYAVGGATTGGTLTLTTCGAVKTSQPPVADPFGSLVMPTAGTPKNFNANTAQCGDTFSGMNIKNAVSLPACGPGQAYIVSGGTLNVNANANFSCSGCSFVLENGASLSINGNSHLNLSAPTGGAYSGMLFMSDRSNTSTLTINGDSTSLVTGAIYAPDGSVSFLGNFAGVSGCTQIVAQTIAWSGSTTFADDCSAYGMGRLRIGGVVRLSA
jgi:Putative Flp pilus-assembly TadE/G-like